MLRQDYLIFFSAVGYLPINPNKRHGAKADKIQTHYVLINNKIYADVLSAAVQMLDVLFPAKSEIENWRYKTYQIEVFNTFFENVFKKGNNLPKIVEEELINNLDDPIRRFVLNYLDNYKGFMFSVLDIVDENLGDKELAVVSNFISTTYESDKVLSAKLFSLSKKYSKVIIEQRTKDVVLVSVKSYFNNVESMLKEAARS